MMKKQGVIVQARLESTRLPGKIVKPFFEDLSILDIVLIRLKSVSRNTPIILATGDIEKNLPLKTFADRHQVHFFAGNENDVLHRFISCAEQFNIEKVVRVCCDNPFLDKGLFLQMMNHPGDYEYLSYRVGGKPAILSHYGFFTEMTTLKALKKAFAKPDITNFDKEHVTRYLYMHPETFDIEFIDVPAAIEKAEDVRLTVDTEVDFNNARNVMTRMQNMSKYLDYNYEDVLRASREIPGLNDSMKNQILANSK